MSFSFPYFAAAFLTVKVRDLLSGVELVFCIPSFKLLLSVKVFQSTDVEIWFPQNMAQISWKNSFFFLKWALLLKTKKQWGGLALLCAHCSQ